MNVIGMPGIVGEGNNFNMSSPSSSLHNGGGGGTNNNKRPLASCREELEHSWRTLGEGQPSSMHLVSQERGSGIVEESDDDMVIHGRNKRRRTGLASTSSIITDDSMNTVVDDSDGAANNTSMASTGACDNSDERHEYVRISPDNRPPFAMITDPTAASDTSSSRNNRPPIKAGWYTGTLSVNGHRHGHGKTKHDDGTSYTGPYVNDAMNGYGTYTFTTTRHLVPNPKMNGNSLHRVIEKSYEGTFNDDAPLGKGIMITKTVDSLPFCGGVVGWTAKNYSVPSNIQQVEVIHDVGMHNSEGVAVGEGVRIVYAGSSTDNGIELQQECFRLHNGKVTMKVALDYASWVCSCMGMEVPSPPNPTLSDDMSMMTH